MSKVAVVLFNLGGPDKQESIKPFLRNFFNDPNIIGAPKLIRKALAWYISTTRSKGEALEAYAQLGYKSPLLENTQAQSDALEQALAGAADQVKCFVCMRYWHPMADEVAAQVKEYNPDQIILLPLYPQYSTTTSRSSFQEWFKAAAKQGLAGEKQVSMICCYPMDQGFIKASAELVRKKYEEVLAALPDESLKPRVLFSAHGLPEKIIKAGDPYQWQCEQSAASIAAETGIDDLDWQICYQSRVGPLKWIGPSTDEAIEKAAADKVPLLVYPHAFVSEHVETLVEIEDEYREVAEGAGVPYFQRVNTVMTHPLFIEGLATLVKDHIKVPGEMNHHQKGRLCPADFGNCCQEQGFCLDGETPICRKQPSN